MKSLLVLLFFLGLTFSSMFPIIKDSRDFKKGIVIHLTK